MAGLVSKQDRIRASLLAGAIGDALGAAVEFDDLPTIRQRFGTGGIRDFVSAYGRLGAITDDTQMTLFTAEGLIRAELRRRTKGIDSRPEMLHRAYLRWMATQQGGTPTDSSGWLMSLAALHARRAPGNTCLSALRSGEAGSIQRPINDSKGCGGVMRVAPIGLAHADPAEAFRLACEAAAITHGHPSGYLSAGMLAAIICLVHQGVALRAAVDEALSVLRRYAGSEETEDAVTAAVLEADRGSPDAEAVLRLGAGWVGEEALAIGLYCALATGSLEDAIVLAVNHGGDSDSTGSIAGNIAGAMYGPSAIPERWLAPLELRDEIERIGDDLFRLFHDCGFDPGAEGSDRYPP